MKVYHVPDGEWFMVVRTHKWYKKTGENPTYVTATQVGSTTEFNIPKEELVILQKK